MGALATVIGNLCVLLLGALLQFYTQRLEGFGGIGAVLGSTDLLIYLQDFSVLGDIEGPAMREGAQACDNAVFLGRFLGGIAQDWVVHFQ